MDDAEARAILHEHGEDPPARGKLAPKWHNIAAGYRADAPPDDYDGGVTAADFTVADEPPEEAPGEEIAPARPQSTRPKLGDRLKTARTKGRTRAKRPGKKHPRVPLDRLLGHVWEGLARVAAPVSVPASRCLQIQSGYAGLVLEDAAKGTFIDRALQPVARAEERGRKVAGLVGPVVCVLGLEQAQGLPEPQRAVREAILRPLLLECLMLMDDVSAEYADRMVEREREQGPKIERAQRWAAMIFAPTVAPDGVPMSDEDRAAANAQAHA